MVYVNYKLHVFLRMWLRINDKDRFPKFNPLSANFPKWSNTLKQFVGNLPTISLSVFDRFVGLTLKGLIEDVVFFLKSLD